MLTLRTDLLLGTIALLPCAWPASRASVAAPLQADGAQTGADSGALTVPLAPVPGESTCTFFDEGAMRARLLSPDLAAREVAFDQLLGLARQHVAIRSTVAAWGRDTASLELAWTSRLIIRELRNELQQFTTGGQQLFRIEVREQRPWEQDYQRQTLLDHGINPDEYRVRGWMRLSPDDAERLGAQLHALNSAQQPRATSQPSAPIEEVLGVACDESLRQRVVLTRVVQGSIADSIGLAVGDQLLSVAGLELAEPADVTEAMQIWNSRSDEAGDVLEVLALDGRTGKSKVLVWIPPSAR